MELLDRAERKKAANGARGGEECSETAVQPEQMNRDSLKGRLWLEDRISAALHHSGCVRVCVVLGAT